MSYTDREIFKILSLYSFNYLIFLSLFLLSTCLLLSVLWGEKVKGERWNVSIMKNKVV